MVDGNHHLKTKMSEGVKSRFGRVLKRSRIIDDEEESESKVSASESEKEEDEFGYEDPHFDTADELSTLYIKA